MERVPAFLWAHIVGYAVDNGDRGSLAAMATFLSRTCSRRSALGHSLHACYSDHWVWRVMSARCWTYWPRCLESALLDAALEPDSPAAEVDGDDQGASEPSNNQFQLVFLKVPVVSWPIASDPPVTIDGVIDWRSLVRARRLWEKKLKHTLSLACTVDEVDLLLTRWLGPGLALFVDYLLTLTGQANGWTIDHFITVASSISAVVSRNQSLILSEFDAVDDGAPETSSLQSQSQTQLFVVALPPRDLAKPILPAGIDLEHGACVLDVCFSALQPVSVDLVHRYVSRFLDNGARHTTEYLLQQAEQPRWESVTWKDKLKAGNRWFFELAGFGPAPDHQYYDLKSSAVSSVVRSRQGIPISLIVVYILFFRRLGVRVRALPLPMHLMARVDPAEGESDGSPVFIDVYNNKRYSDESGVRSFIEQRMAAYTGNDASLGQAQLPWSSWLTPMSDRQLLARMLHNVYRYARDSGRDRRLMVVTTEMAIQFDQLTGDWQQSPRTNMEQCVDLAKSYLHYELFNRSVRALQQNLSTAAGDDEESAGWDIQGMVDALRAVQRQEYLPVQRRSQHPAIAYRVGQVVLHAKYHYRGVICGWSPRCRLSVAWQTQMGVTADMAVRPFYDVLVNNRDRQGNQTTHVCAHNIIVQDELGLPDVELARPDFGQYFCGRRNNRFLLNRRLKHLYPEDDLDVTETAPTTRQSNVSSGDSDGRLTRDWFAHPPPTLLDANFNEDQFITQFDEYLNSRLDMQEEKIN